MKSNQEISEKIMNDIRNVINYQGTGKVYIKDYIDMDESGACMDFAMLYEMSDELQRFINEERRKGKNIQINEDNITVL